jgi:hypothetical protein
LIALIINIHPLGVNGHCIGQSFVRHVSFETPASVEAFALRETHMTERPALLLGTGPHSKNRNSRASVQLTNASSSGRLQDLRLAASQPHEGRMSARGG